MCLVGNQGCVAPLHNGGAEDLKQYPTNQEGINQAVSSSTFYILSSICRLNWNISTESQWTNTPGVLNILLLLKYYFFNFQLVKGDGC